jgi:gliding motility-associated-like protein
MQRHHYIVSCVGLFLGLFFLPFSVKAEVELLPKSTASFVEITGVNVLCGSENRSTTFTVTVPFSYTRLEWRAKQDSALLATNTYFIPITSDVDYSVFVRVYGTTSGGSDTLLGRAERTLFITEKYTAARVNDTLCPGENRAAIVGMKDTEARYFLWSFDPIINPHLVGDTINHWEPQKTGDSINFWMPPLVTRTVLTAQMSTHSIRGNENECYWWDSAFVEIDSIRFRIVGDTMVCEGGTVTLSVIGAKNHDILWSNSSRDTTITVVIPVFGDTIFWVDSEDLSRECRGRYSFTVIGLPVPKGIKIIPDVEDSVVCRGAPAMLTVTCDDGQCASFRWTNSRETSESIQIWPRERFIYSLTAFGGPNQTGCSATASIVIDVKNCDLIYFPTALRLSSQNPDNRVFRPVGVPRDYTEYYFAIFNRWGQLIFESRNLDVGWNGTHQGENVRPGTYVYLFRLTNRYDVWERMGTVTVID